MVLEVLEKQVTHYNEQDKILIRKAYEKAYKCHENQRRASGDNYIIHPIAVACEIAKLKLDAKTIAASLLHDVMEDCDVKREEIVNDFGEEIAFMVNGVSKLDKIQYHGAQRKVESLRKMFLAVAEDVRVVIIKIFDRLHNMQTISSLQPEKQRSIAEETIELYAPLAYRLGMGETKGQLEDLAFPILYPEEYKWVIDEIKERVPARKKYLERLMPLLTRELSKENIKPKEINWRAKHYYSLWKKLLKNDLDFGRVFDLVAVRIIVNSVEECYAILGIIHKLWKPLPGRIKDYIALPKPNGYQSLHTTVFALNGKITEFQIRTIQMHEEAEFGVAAHWAYEEASKISRPIKIGEQKSSLIKQLREWREKFSDSTGEEFMESLKIDFFKDRIFVLTPKGEVIDLPEGSTPIDFAYQVHSEIGDHMSGAKVNGKLVSFSYALATGDTVEILIQKKRSPSPDWLDVARTSIAKSHIRSALRKTGVNLPQSKRPEKQMQEVALSVRVRDRIGLLKDISSQLAKEKINIRKIDSDSQKTSYPVVTFHFLAPLKGRILDRIIVNTRKIKGVEEVSIEKITP